MIMTMLIMAAAINCIDLPNQAAMNQCQAQAAERADARMNRVWRETRAIMAKADTEKRDGAGLHGVSYSVALLASQRAWLAYRDAECLIESYEWRGGTMQYFTDSQCRVEVTDARTRQLRDVGASIASYNRRDLPR